MANESVRDRYVNDGAGVVPQPRLLVMLYDRLVLDLQNADTALAAGNIETVNEKLIHAQQIVTELHSALDNNAWDGAESLGQLYVWFTSQLIEANTRKEPRNIRSCLQMCIELQSAWHSAYEQLLAEQAADKTAAIAANTTVSPSA